MHRDALAFSSINDANADQDPLMYFPALETFPGFGSRQDSDVSGYRLQALLAMARRLSNPDSACASPPLIATSVQALMQRTLPPDLLLAHTPTVSVSETNDLKRIANQLSADGYRFASRVQEKGEASIRGGILDVWPPTEVLPARLEFNGPMVESIRFFAPVDQRSTEKVSCVSISPASEWMPVQAEDGTEAERGSMASRRPTGQREAPALTSILSYIPHNAVFVWSEPDSIAANGSSYEQVVSESGASGVTLSLKALKAEITRRPGCRQLLVGVASEMEGPVFSLDITSIRGVLEIPRDVLQPDILERTRTALLADLRKRARRGHRVFFLFDTQGSLKHFRKCLADGELDKFRTGIGPLSGGFASQDMRLSVVAESDLYGSRKTLTRRYRPGPEHVSERVSDLSDIEPGDLVAHVDHGIGRYLGVDNIEFNGRMQEVLTIEYADRAMLHVPVSHAHLISRYVGISRRTIRLHRLGGARWHREKAAAHRSILDLASSLLETQAQRELLDGFVSPSDTPWQHEFEASFPYRETPDQRTVVDDVKKDMESPRPMDRLVCGDAGYGKTEVAMRAAFKTVMAGKQTAVLVPTTVLAQQHFQTFRERMSAYPIRIEMLSRFCTRSQHAEIVKGMSKGTVDIVVGTHSLVQSGIRFKDLGLVVIDEEQRFGVAHKERLKQMRRLVDLLTLTATPIPRTLYMSLTGAKEISLLQTPPKERVAIDTIVVRNTDKIVREAIVREISREGQVFYLHNRIMTIDRVKGRIERLVPEARVRVAHGQMPSSKLAEIMRQFVAGRFEILLCTTIIESGMDIPRANTILVDRAERFGIADLYQLRGRVGRSNRKAYAYLLLPSHGQIDADARKRIGAVERHSGLSAGFSLALRDLEIRGAGNLLGSEQSGHITAMGFALYCQLLRRTIARLKGETVPLVIDVDLKLDFISPLSDPGSPDSSAMIPVGYVPTESTRLATYRKIAEASSPSDIRDLEAELRDRFGPVPQTVVRLLKIAELKIACAEKGIASIETRNRKVILAGRRGYLKTGTRFPRLSARNTDRLLDEIIKLVRTADRWAAR